MKTKLDEIISNKRKEIAVKKKGRDFLRAIKNPSEGDISIIAEIKLASPAEGKLGEEKELEEKVSLYEKGGADAISIVVDKTYFGGELEFIRRIKTAVSLPVLAKDFIIDPYQIYQMKAYGADAVLLIAKIVSFDKLARFVKLARELNMEPIVEVHNEKELPDAIQTETRIIAVNARNLDTFKIDVDMASRLLKLIPPKYVTLGFSGVKNCKDAKKYKNAGAKGILVGTSLMRAHNINGFIRRLKGVVV